MKQWCLADARSCGAKIAPSRIEHHNAGLGVLASRTFKKRDVIGSHYKQILYQDLSSC